MKKWMTTLIVLGSMLAVAPNASAALLAPGTALTSPGDFSGTASPSLSLVATMSSPFGASDPQNKHAIAGTLVSSVYKDAGTGFLTFFYQIQATTSFNSIATDGIEHLSVSGFAGFSILNANYVTDKGGSTPFAAISRSSDGDNVDGDFPLVGGLAPGTTSYTLMLQTNATSFGGETAFIIDHAIASADTFAPAPLPSSLVMFGTGLIGLAGGFVRRIRKHLPLLA